MSHRALVAERQQNGQFSLYHSQNGAENIQLLDELRNSLNVHGRIDFESLTGQRAPKIVQQLAARSSDNDTFNINQAENIVDPKPIATDLPKEAILLGGDILQYEVLYVVDNGEVTGYWLAWLYPDVIQPWRDHMEVEVYNNSSTVTDLVEYIENNDPYLIIGDFEETWLENSEKRAIIEDYHRWIYELQFVQSNHLPDNSDKMKGMIQTEMYNIVFHTDKTEPLIPTTYPFFVPIRLDSSATDPETEIRETANHIRFCLGSELEAYDTVSEDKIHRAYSEVAHGIMESFTDDIAPEFIPGKLGILVEDYQKTRQMKGFGWD